MERKEVAEGAEGWHGCMASVSACLRSALMRIRVGAVRCGWQDLRGRCGVPSGRWQPSGSWLRWWRDGVRSRGARRRCGVSHASVRSTTHRRGSTANPRWSAGCGRCRSWCARSGPPTRPVVRRIRRRRRRTCRRVPPDTGPAGHPWRRRGPGRRRHTPRPSAAARGVGADEPLTTWHFLASVVCNIRSPVKGRSWRFFTAHRSRSGRGW